MEIPRTSVSSSPSPPPRAEVASVYLNASSFRLVSPGRGAAHHHTVFSCCRRTIVVPTLCLWPSSPGGFGVTWSERLAHTARHTRPQRGQRLSAGPARPLMQPLAEGLWLPCPPLELSAWSNMAGGRGEGCSAASQAFRLRHFTPWNKLETRRPLGRLRGQSSVQMPRGWWGSGDVGAPHAVTRDWKEGTVQPLPPSSHPR